MRALLGILLGTIAVGVMLIAYGLIAGGPTAAQEVNRLPADGVYPFAQTVGQRVGFEQDLRLAGQGVQIRCEPGQRAVLRQMSGAALAECVDAAVVDRYDSVVTPASYRVSQISQVSEPQAQVRRVSSHQVAAVRTTRRAERDWQKTALVVGGSTAAGAGLGAIFGGKTGALIGAAIGGGASSLWEAKH